MKMRTYLQAALSSDAMYEQMMKDSVKRWSEEYFKIKKQLENFQLHKDTTLSRRDVTILSERINHLAQYLSETQQRLEEVSNRVHVSKQLIRSYAD